MSSHLLELRFPHPLDTRLGPEIARRVLYLSEGIERFDLLQGPDGIRGVALEMRDGAAPSADALTGMLLDEVRGMRTVPAKTVWEYRGGRARGPGTDKLLDELLGRGLAYVHGPGTVGFTGILVDLFDVIGRLFETISVAVADAERFQFPTLVRTEALERGGYLDSFPQLLMFADRLRNSPDDFRRFAARHAPEGEPYDRARALVETHYCLPPTMCYYVYDMLTDKVLPKSRSFTAAGKSFRFENAYESPFRRLWDFTIRETVWVGGRDFVRAGLDGYRLAATGLCEALAVAGSCESASDPFFLAPDGAAVSTAQRVVGSKLELRLALGEAETVAAGSFNHHGHHLAERFAIRVGDEPDGTTAHTGCVGIGLERFMLAFLSQHGCDPDGWPPLVAEAVAQNRFPDLRDLVTRVSGEAP